MISAYDRKVERTWWRVEGHGVGGEGMRGV